MKTRITKNKIVGAVGDIFSGWRNDITADWKNLRVPER